MTVILISRRIIRAFFGKQCHPSYKCKKVTDISQRKSILCKNGHCFLCLEKGHLMKNCSINYQCNKCKDKHNITIYERPRKLDPNTKKDCNPANMIQGNETLATFQPCYRELTQTFLTMNYL